MKRDPRTYAKAFAAVAAGDLSAAKEKQIVANFSRILSERVGRGQWPKFIAAAEKALREKEGIRKVTIESARPMKDARHQFKSFIKASDVIEEKTDPALVAGVRLTVDDSRQYDGSMRAKLNKLF